MERHFLFEKKKIKSLFCTPVNKRNLLFKKKKILGKTNSWEKNEYFQIVVKQRHTEGDVMNIRYSFVFFFNIQGIR